ncbi:glycosyltransferase [Arthrobacter sp. TMN-37]
MNTAFGPAQPGVIAMAAYKPQADLFLRQLTSIQNQTVPNFVCLISADGDQEDVRRMVRDSVGSDPRFQVIGFDNRLGFYGNFERVLGRVPDDAAWVSLSDQDDYWYPEKLERLLPHLRDHVLVAGQARVVSSAAPEVAISVTRRKNVPLDHLIIQNQFTGGQTVFRPELLKLALPFPRFDTLSQVHDHWLAVCAAAVGSAHIVDEVLQDYVQHTQNALGEVGGRWSITSSFRRVRGLVTRYEKNFTVRSALNFYHRMSYGWRFAMLAALEERLPSDGASDWGARSAFASAGRRGSTSMALLQGVRSGAVAPGCAGEFVVGAPAEIIRRLKRSVHRG